MSEHKGGSYVINDAGNKLLVQRTTQTAPAKAVAPTSVYKKSKETAPAVDQLKSKGV